MYSNRKSNLRYAFTHLEARADEHLSEYFHVTAPINALRNPHEAAIAVGMKGTGKTAAFRYLTEFDETQDITLAINSRTHRLRLDQTDLKYADYAFQFEADIVMDALRQIAQRRVSLQQKNSTLLDLDGQLKAASKLVKNYVARIEKQLSKIVGVSVMGFGFSLAKSENVPLPGLQRKEVVGADKILKAICNAGVKVRIVVDDPENVFSTGRELDTHLIGGLCLAAMEINNYSENLKLIVLLKTHVFAPVIRQIEDVYPKFPKELTQLVWDHKSLAELVRRRLSWLARNNQQGDGPGLNELFDASTESEADSMLASMTSMIRNGPRDLIYWIDRALEKAGDRTRITRKDLDDVVPDVSMRSFIELESAYHEQYPDLGDLIRAIFHKKTVYPTADFLRHIGQLWIKDANLRKLNEHTWKQQLTADAVPAKLLEVGAVGFESGGQKFLPYMRGYEPKNFEAADRVYLCPLLAHEIVRKI